MTRRNLELYIASKINDNTTGAITAKDVRVVLMTLYDSMLSAGANGIVLPIGTDSVEDANGNPLDIELDTIRAALGTAGDVSNWADFRQANNVVEVLVDLLSKNLTVQNAIAQIVMSSTDTNPSAFIKMAHNTQDRFTIGFDAVTNTDGIGVITLIDETDTVVCTITIDKDGNVKNANAPTTASDDSDMVTLGQVKDRYEKIIQSPIQAIDGTPTKAECVNAMNSAGYDFANDVEFYIEDSGFFVKVIYRANGDTDEADTNYKFYCFTGSETV